MNNLPRSQSLPSPFYSVPPSGSAESLSCSEFKCGLSELDHKTSPLSPSQDLSEHCVKLDSRKHPIFSYARALTTTFPAGLEKSKSPSVSRRMSDNLYRRFTTSASAASDLNKHAEQLRKARMEEVQTAAHRRRQTRRMRSFSPEHSTPGKPDLAAAPLADLPANPTTWSPPELALYLAHVLNLGPARLVADIRSYVIGAGMGGRRFLKMSRKEFQQTGLNRNWVTMMRVARNNLREECRRNRAGAQEIDWEDDENLSSPTKSKILSASHKVEQRSISQSISAGQVADMAKHFEEDDSRHLQSFATGFGSVVNGSGECFRGGSCNPCSVFDPTVLVPTVLPGLPSVHDTHSRKTRRGSVASSVDSASSVLSTDAIDLNSIALIRSTLIQDSLLEEDQMGKSDENSIVFRSPSPLGTIEGLISSSSHNYNLISTDRNHSGSNHAALDAQGSIITAKAPRSAPQLDIKSSRHVSARLDDGDSAGPSLTVKPFKAKSSTSSSLSGPTCYTNTTFSSATCHASGSLGGDAKGRFSTLTIRPSEPKFSSVSPMGPKNDGDAPSLCLPTLSSQPFEITPSSHASAVLGGEERDGSSALTIQPFKPKSCVSSLISHEHDTGATFPSPTSNLLKLSPIQSQTPDIVKDHWCCNGSKEEDKSDGVEALNSPHIDDLKYECALMKELLALTEELLNTPQREPRLDYLGRPSAVVSEDSCDSLNVSASKLRAMEKQLFEIENRLQRLKSREFPLASRDVSISYESEARTDPSSWTELGGYLLMATLGLGIVAGRVIASKALGWKKA